MLIRTNLPLLMKNRGITIMALAEDYCIPRATLGLIANGRMVPTDKQLEAICYALGVTPDMVYPDPAVRKALAE